MVVKKIEEFDLKKIAESGQCFRLNETGENSYRLVALDKCLDISVNSEGEYVFHCSEEEFNLLWEDYFDLKEDYGKLQEIVDPEDKFLSQAFLYGRGMRILRQDPWEMTASFIISQRKSILSIKQCVEALSRHFGKPVSHGEETLYTFPKPDVLAGLSLEDLSSCSLGYRDKYILAAAQHVAQGKLDFDRVKEADNETALEMLKDIYGVGTKVANCILLFGFSRRDAFPEDVWIKRIVDKEYGGSFPLERYKGYGGIIQQYMFYYGRSKEYGGR